MAKSQQHLGFPTRKISETFLEFAAPLFEPHGVKITEAQMEKELMVAFTVWNSVVWADALGENDVLDDIRATSAKHPGEAELVECLITRKRRLYGHDHRLIGQYKVFRRGGTLRLQAEARDPYSAKRRIDERTAGKNGSQEGD